MDIYVVMQDGTRRYYLMKVQRRDNDVYCFAPGSGVHLSRHSRHDPPVSHFRPDVEPGDTGTASSVVLMPGEAGRFVGDDIISSPLTDDLGVSTGICHAICTHINRLSDNYREFTKTGKPCFVIDRAWLPADAGMVTIGVSAVPGRNTKSFQSDHPNVPPQLLFKVAAPEPQIWICAET